MQLDFRTDEVNNLMVTPMFEDVSEPFTSDVRQGFVYAGDTIRFTGQYAFRDGIYDSVYINPEVEMTMEIIRQMPWMTAARATFSIRVKPFTTPSQAACLISTSRLPCSPMNISTPRVCPPSDDVNPCDAEEDYSLPNGAEDVTSSICATSTSYGCGSIEIKVDRTAPEVVAQTWLAEKGALPAGTTDRFIANTLSTADYHCVDIQAIIKEQEAMFW